MRTLIMLITIASFTAMPLQLRAQQTLPSDAEAVAFKQLAEAIPLGSRIRVQARGGRRITATLLAVTPDAIVIKRESRVPEPALSIAYSELTRLQLDKRSGFTVAKALGIGLAAGVGAILTLFAIAVSIDD